MASGGAAGVERHDSDSDPRRVPGVKKILVLRRHSLGDILLTLPAVRALKESYPESQVDVLVDRPFAHVVEGLPYVDQVFRFPERRGGRQSRPAWSERLSLYRLLRARRYDLVIDALGTPATALLCLVTGARVRAGFDIPGRTWAYHRVVPRSDRRRPTYMRDAYLELVAAVGAQSRDRSFAPAGFVPQDRSQGAPERFSGGPRITLAPGATWSAKAWPLEHYVRLARLLVDRLGAKVTVSWGPGEEALADRLVAAEPRAHKAPGGSVADLATRLAREDLLISSDSGARHVAVGLGIPTLGLFGPTDIPTATPPEGRHATLTHPMPCAPCQLTRCPLAENYCLTKVEPETVFETARRLLEQEIVAR